MHYAIKFLLAAVIVVAVCNYTTAQSKKTQVTPKLENQVKQYWFVMLIAGKDRTQDSATAAKIQEGHMANINRLYYEGKLKVAGPFGDDGNWKGIFIFDCKTKEELEALLNTDPAIAAGRLAYEIHPWWTAATGSFVPGKPKKTKP
ncbi:YciI family protein [Ferruginibacter sp. SUN106]|uniref:YciI family protein n=1 Tax=Ferruginibacter sp. SUN106 TaxID=2978348 RepID=UPI003D364D88